MGAATTVDHVKVAHSHWLHYQMSTRGRFEVQQTQTAGASRSSRGDKEVRVEDEYRRSNQCRVTERSNATELAFGCVRRWLQRVLRGSSGWKATLQVSVHRALKVLKTGKSDISISTPIHIGVTSFTHLTLHSLQHDGAIWSEPFQLSLWFLIILSIAYAAFCEWSYSLQFRRCWTPCGRWVVRLHRCEYGWLSSPVLSLPRLPNPLYRSIVFTNITGKDKDMRRLFHYR